MEIFIIECFNFKEGFFFIKMYFFIYGFDWFMYFDVWVVGYFFVLKFWQQLYVLWNNCRKDNKEVSYIKLISCFNLLLDL